LLLGVAPCCSNDMIAVDTIKKYFCKMGSKLSA
jgi:hypothetical protein